MINVELKHENHKLNETNLFSKTTSIVKRKDY